MFSSRILSQKHYYTRTASSPPVDPMLEIMKCNLCGKLAMIIRDGGRRTICCDQLMEKLVEQGPGAQAEGHVPVIEKKGTGIRVKVPGVVSPMDGGHYIEWIEVTEGKKLQVMGLVSRGRSGCRFRRCRSGGESQGLLRGAWPVVEPAVKAEGVNRQDFGTEGRRKVIPGQETRSKFFGGIWPKGRECNVYPVLPTLA